ncbi:MAG TPA: IS1182 family transposase [Syntrophales bacterium]|nr:IS1182 family transposase [Syntrophales bacterium]
MMGMDQKPQGSLFHIGIDMEKRVRANHPLRKVRERIDFDFTYSEVKDRYGHNGNVSIPPPVILKLMLLLIFYNVRSERELMDTLPERMDWLWFLGYDLETVIPNHSVLSKARKRWGEEVFRSFFERVVLQCVEAGLVDGRKIFVDSSLVDADASNNSIIDTKNLKQQLHRNYRKLESRLAEAGERTSSPRKYRKTNDRYMSTTDPDAGIVNRGKAKLTYQVHRVVDGQSEIITATDAAPGDVNEASLMLPLLDQHNEITGLKAATIVCDSKYGTIENFLACHDRGIQAHTPDLHEVAVKRMKKQGLFSEDCFVYDPVGDTYRCPAGNFLKPKSLHRNRSGRDYAAPKKICAACGLRDQCTKNKTGRTIMRHLRQADLEMMREASRSPESKRDIRTRQHLMERSFARATRYNFDRARWRGLWKMKIQEYMTCAIQNIQVLISQATKRKNCAVARASAWSNRLITSVFFLLLALWSSNAPLRRRYALVECAFQKTESIA